MLQKRHLRVLVAVIELDPLLGSRIRCTIPLSGDQVDRGAVLILQCAEFYLLCMWQHTNAIYSSCPLALWSCSVVLKAALASTGG
jgi:hypothetical protein